MAIRRIRKLDSNTFRTVEDVQRFYLAMPKAGNESTQVQMIRGVMMRMREEHMCGMWKKFLQKWGKEADEVHNNWKKFEKGAVDAYADMLTETEGYLAPSGTTDSQRT